MTSIRRKRVKSVTNHACGSSSEACCTYILRIKSTNYINLGLSLQEEFCGAAFSGREVHGPLS